MALQCSNSPVLMFFIDTLYEVLSILDTGMIKHGVVDCGSFITEGEIVVPVSLSCSVAHWGYSSSLRFFSIWWKCVMEMAEWLTKNYTCCDVTIDLVLLYCTRTYMYPRMHVSLNCICSDTQTAWCYCCH